MGNTFNPSFILGNSKSLTSDDKIAALGKIARENLTETNQNKRAEIIERGNINDLTSIFRRYVCLNNQEWIILFDHLSFLIGNSKSKNTAFEISVSEDSTRDAIVEKYQQDQVVRLERGNINGSNKSFHNNALFVWIL